MVSGRAACPEQVIVLWQCPRARLPTKNDQNPTNPSAAFHPCSYVLLKHALVPRGRLAVMIAHCFALTPVHADSMLALAEDHLNDVISNVSAIGTAAIASEVRVVLGRRILMFTKGADLRPGQMDFDVG